MQVQLHNGDCIEVMRTLDDNSVDSVVTDPPYELGFMGKSWDSSGIAFNVEVWKEALRVLKPGGHLLAFSGSRTYHRMAVAIEDAGFEVRDQIMWIYGSGFPKSMDISKALDKVAGAEREVISQRETSFLARKTQDGSSIKGDMLMSEEKGIATIKITAPATDAAKQWQGWGTALKPAHEPIVMARKPIKGTVANNVLTWGVGGLNIDASRVDAAGEQFSPAPGGEQVVTNLVYGKGLGVGNGQHELGRWPANVIHDGDPYVVELFPNEAARFFYCAKASKRDRNEGLDGFPVVKGGSMSGIETRPNKPTNQPMRQNHHPTVKPTDLMAYLCRLVTPKGGTVLDPFMGSGSTGKACAIAGFDFIGIEQDADYMDIAKARIEYAQKVVRDADL